MDNEKRCFMNQLKQNFETETVLQNIVKSDKMQLILQTLKQEGQKQNVAKASKATSTRTLN